MRHCKCCGDPECQGRAVMRDLSERERYDVITKLKAENAALVGLLKKIYNSQAITNNTAIDLEKWADDVLSLLNRESNCE